MASFDSLVYSLSDKIAGLGLLASVRHKPARQAAGAFAFLERPSDE